MSGPMFSAAELGAGRSAVEDRGLVALGRELAALDPGEVAARPSFVEAVMATVAAEPTPRPSSAWVAALRRRRPARALAALRDSFRVAFGPAARPLGARAAAVPVAVATMLLAGSLGVVGAGAAGVRLPDSSPPTPTAPAVVPSVGPTLPPTPSLVPEPSPTPTPFVPLPTVSPSPERSGDPSETPESGDAGDGADRTHGPSEHDDHETPEPSDHESHDTPEPSDHHADETPRPSSSAGRDDD